MIAPWQAIQRYLQRRRRGRPSPRSSPLATPMGAGFSPRPSPMLPPLAPPPAHENRLLQQLLGTSLGTAVLVLTLRGLGVLQGPELDLYDLMIQSRPRPPMQPLVVGFGEDYLAHSGAWPLRDEILAQVLQTIDWAEPVAIGVDIYWDTPLAPGRESLKNLHLRRDNLYTIQQMKDRNLPRIKAPSILIRKGQGGFNNVVLDHNGRLRRSLLYWWEKRTGHRSFALKLAEHYLAQRDIRTIRAPYNPDWVQLGQMVLSQLNSNSGGYQNQEAAAGYQIFADFIGGQGTVPMINAQNILDGNFDPAALANRVVLVGMVADSVQDSFQTPYTVLQPAKPVSGPVSGGEMQAQLVMQLLDWAQGDRPVLRSWSEGAEILWIMVWCVAGAALGLIGKESVHTTAWTFAGNRQLVVLGYGSLLWGGGIPVVPMVLGGLATAGILTMLNTQQRHELERSKEFLNSVIAAVPEPVFVQDQDHRWVVLNPAFGELMGYPLEQLLNKRPTAVLSPACAATFQALDQQLLPPGVTHSLEVTLCNASGRVLTVLLKRACHCDRAGNRFWVGTLQDITAQKHLEARLTQRADDLKRRNEQLQHSQEKLSYHIYHDPLTSLGNRQFLYRQLTRLVRRGPDQEGRGIAIGVLFLDLDGFKAVNDQWGHQAGDEILVETARRLRGGARGGDVITRLAGDEFVVILPWIPYYEVVDRVSNKIIRSIQSPFQVNGDRITAAQPLPFNRLSGPESSADPSSTLAPDSKRAGETEEVSPGNAIPPVTVTVSIGISFYPDDAKTPEHLIAAADHAMLAAKRQGKNNYQYYATLSPIDLRHSRHALDWDNILDVDILPALKSGDSLAAKQP